MVKNNNDTDVIKDIDFSDIEEGLVSSPTAIELIKKGEVPESTLSLSSPQVEKTKYEKKDVKIPVEKKEVITEDTRIPKKQEVSVIENNSSTEHLIDFSDDIEYCINDETNESIVTVESDDDSLLPPIEETKNLDKDEFFKENNIDPEELKTRVSVPLSSVDTTTKKLKDIMDDDVQLENIFSPRPSYNRDLHRSHEAHTLQQQFALDSFKHVATNGENCFSEDPDTLKDRISFKNRTVNTKGKLLEGKDAILAAVAKACGIIKLNLWNSGFYVVMQASQLSELNALYNSIKTTAEFEYGKEFGAHWYLYMDTDIKHHIMDMLYNSIVDSNFINWRQKSDFYEVMSFADYESLIWGQTALMYRKGIEITFTCGMPNCSYSKKIDVDVSKLRLNNYTRIPEKCVQFMANKNTKTKEDLLNYRNDLAMTKSFRIGEHGFKLKIPSMSEYFTEAENYNAKLIGEVHQKTNSEDVGQFLRYNFYRVYSPWIEKYISYESDTSEAVAFASEDQSVFADILAFQQTRVSFNNDSNDEFDNIFDKEISDFIKESKLSIIAYPFTTCPDCGTAPETGYLGLIPYDVQHDFFTMARIVLERRF